MMAGRLITHGQRNSGWSMGNGGQNRPANNATIITSAGGIHVYWDYNVPITISFWFKFRGEGTHTWAYVFTNISMLQLVRNILYNGKTLLINYDLEEQTVIVQVCKYIRYIMILGPLLQ